MKELEQQLQSLEAQKMALLQRRGDTASERGAPRAPDRGEAATNSSASVTGEEAAERAPFARFFRYPQYAWRHAPAREDGGAGAEEASRASAVADVEVGVVVDAHASLRVMARRRPGQLLKMVAGMQALGLAVLHLNVTAAPGGLALYTLSLKVRRRRRPHRLSLPELQRLFYSFRSRASRQERNRKTFWVAVGCAGNGASPCQHFGHCAAMQVPDQMLYLFATHMRNQISFFFLYWINN